MWPTVEVRWFYPGQTPSPLLAWFHQVEGEAEAQPCRVDHYLRLKATEALGIKLREGRIEIKQRQRRLGLVRFHERVAGQVEAWRKWSFALTGAGAGLAGSLVPASAWIAVEKERTLLLFRVAGGGRIVSLPPASYEAYGCGLELTRIRAKGAAWWSLGLEAFGQEATLQESLVTVARHLLASEAGPHLDSAASCGYPRWLNLPGSGLQRRLELPGR
jgi:hypothetical protein